MSEPRTLCWVSQGAASIIAARMELRSNPAAILVRCETGNEDEDNHRFEAYDLILALLTLERERAKQLELAVESLPSSQEKKNDHE